MMMRRRSANPLAWLTSHPYLYPLRPMMPDPALSKLISKKTMNFKRMKFWTLIKHLKNKSKHKHRNSKTTVQALGSANSRGRIWVSRRNQANRIYPLASMSNLPKSINKL